MTSSGRGFRARNDPHVHPPGWVISDARELPFLQEYGAGFTLSWAHELSDLVEEQGPPVASSTRPAFRPPAPVKAPFTCRRAPIR